MRDDGTLECNFPSIVTFRRTYFILGALRSWGVFEEHTMHPHIKFLLGYIRFFTRGICEIAMIVTNRQDGGRQLFIFIFKIVRGSLPRFLSNSSTISSKKIRARALL